MPPQRRFGRTALEKWKICQARQEPGQRAGEMKHLFLMYNDLLLSI